MFFAHTGSFPMSGRFPSDGPKYWSFSLSGSPSDEYSGLISFRMDWFDLLAVQGTLKSLLEPRFEFRVLERISLGCLFYCWRRILSKDMIADKSWNRKENKEKEKIVLGKEC